MCRLLLAAMLLAPLPGMADLATTTAMATATVTATAAVKPNFLILFVDDLVGNPTHTAQPSASGLRPQMVTR